MADPQVALVTGGNRGIGLEIVCQLAEAGVSVLAGSRAGEASEEMVRTLEGRGVGALVRTVSLDVTDPASVAALPGQLDEEFGQLDVLVNNAGVNLDGWTAPSALDPDVLQATLEVNLHGAIRVTRAFLPLLERSTAGRIVNVSSTLGSLADMADPRSGFREVVCPAYRISKAGLNVYTQRLAHEYAGSALQVNAACPGWVRTRLGGEDAPRSVAEGADTPVWLALQGDDGPSGAFFRDRKRIPW